MPTFYCYSRCSTCKKAEKWLKEKGVDYDKVDLVETPPSKDQFVKWLSQNKDKRGVRRFFNTSGQHYREQGLKDKVGTMSIDEAATLLSSDGKLIKRPLMVDGDTLTVGFKEDVYEETWAK